MKMIAGFGGKAPLLTCFLWMTMTVLIVVVEATDSPLPNGTPCTEDSDCYSLQGIDSICRQDIGLCSNPFESGCLYQRKPGWNKKRVCNSEDPPEAVGVMCTPPQFEDYLEVRIAAGNWESITFNAWLMQILMSELLGVPATIEPGKPDAIMNFYHTTGAFHYGRSNVPPAMEAAYKYRGDCQLARKSPDDAYEPCVNVSPEFWIASDPWSVENAKTGVIEPPEALGVLARETLFIPKFTADRDSTLLSYIGMQGEENRQKLADTFLRPTLWKDYCEEVSINNCSTPDGVADRAPLNEDEANRFFLEGEFMGHFRKTDANNCTLHPTTCTGHIIDYPCEWSSQAEQQLYHLDIALSGDKHGLNKRGHGDWQMVQILHAANATRNNIIILWAMPDPFYQQMIGTDMELHAVIMPPATQECLRHKRSWVDQCSSDMATRVGDPRGACEDPPVLLHKAVSTQLSAANLYVQEASISPAVAAIQQYTMTAPIYGSWFDLLIERDALKENRVTTMRDATCQWVVDNFEELVVQWIPHSYPRTILDAPSQEGGLVTGSITLSVLAIVLVLAAFAVLYASQHRRVMVYAQVEFLWLLLVGLLLISVGALLKSIPPTSGTCIAAIWFVNCGYTVELAPLLVKVAAINRLMTASARMQKVSIDRNALFRSVFGVTACIALFLCVWTALDAPEKEGELELSTDTTVQGNSNNNNSNETTVVVEETIVYRTYYCSSESDVWQYVAFGWTYVLLFSSTVLAFQMRNVRQEFNESMTLSFMTYSHFVFAILRVMVFFLEDVGQSDRASYASILLSVDSMATLLIYFLPKFLLLRTPDRSSQQFTTPSNMSTPMSGSSRNIDVVSSYRFSTSKMSGERVPSSINEIMSEEPSQQSFAAEEAEVEQHVNPSNSPGDKEEENEEEAIPESDDSQPLEGVGKVESNHTVGTD